MRLARKVPALVDKSSTLHINGGDAQKQKKMLLRTSSVMLSNALSDCEGPGRFNSAQICSNLFQHLLNVAYHLFYVHHLFSIIDRISSMQFVTRYEKIYHLQQKVILQDGFRKSLKLFFVSVHS